MDVRLLTDTIVRQTTVLLAQIATAAGIRAPLAHLANQVFGDLAKELEAQGVRRTVVADMFGLALRSYELKIRRLEETTEVQRSAWRAVYSKLEQHSQTRLQLTKSLPNVAARDLSAILNDLVDSGLVYRSGSGTRAVYGVTSDVDWSRREAEDELQTLTNLIWLTLATRGNQERSALEAKFRSDAATFEAAVEELLASKRIEAQIRDGKTVYAAQSFHIPVGAEQGWEAAVCDHFGAVATAIAAKLHSPQARADDRIGGSTLRFTVYPGHPLESEVTGLLSHVRNHVEALWQRVHQHNQTLPPPENAEKFTFYYGQNHTLAEATSNES